MSKIWRNRILAGTRTYAEVPKTWKAGVKVLLRQDVVNEIITAEEYEEIVGEPYYEA